MYNQRMFAIVAVAAVAAMLVATSAISVEDAFAGGKKKYSQTTSQANACGNDFLPTNVGCQNIGSQVQGDENGVALAADQTFPGFDNGHDGFDGGHGHDGKDGKQPSEPLEPAQ
jgi:hypothetical protein